MSGYSSRISSSKILESPVLFVTPKAQVSVPGQAVMSAVESAPGSAKPSSCSLLNQKGNASGRINYRKFK